MMVGKYHWNCNAHTSQPAILNGSRNDGEYVKQKLSFFFDLMMQNYSIIHKSQNFCQNFHHLP